MASGAGGPLWSMWGTVSSQQYDQVYMALRFKIPHDTFQNESGNGTKWFYFGNGEPPGGSANQTILFMVPGGRQGNFKFQTRQQRGSAAGSDLPTKNWDTNISFACNQWVLYEWLLTMNTIGQANGRIQHFVNGVECSVTPSNGVGSANAVTFRTAAMPHAFYAFKWNAVYGGTGGQPKVGDEYNDVDEVLLSGVAA